MVTARDSRKEFVIRRTKLLDGLLVSRPCPNQSVLGSESILMTGGQVEHGARRDEGECRDFPVLRPAGQWQCLNSVRHRKSPRSDSAKTNALENTFPPRRRRWPVIVKVFRQDDRSVLSDQGFCT